ncbi:MAG: phosphatidylglycerophosphatase A [Pseudomonadota bacterium]
MRLPRPDLRRFHHFMAFGFGSGLAPRAPGTFGTVAAIPVYFAFTTLPFWAYLTLTVLAFGAGVFWCGRAARELGVHDHPGIVWDEIVGYLLTMAWVPYSVNAVLAGFLLFRFFDIVKPFPIKWLDEHVEGGFGIMIDDIVAALYAGGVLYWISGRVAEWR